LRALTAQHSTFSKHDLVRFVHRHTDGAEQFAAVLAKVGDHPPLWWTPRVSSCGGRGAYDDEEDATRVHGRIQA